MRRFDVLLGFILLQCVIICIGVRSGPRCSRRSESDARCRKECKTDADCRNRKNNKRCICDGPCGLSCIRINQKCYEDRSLVIKLRKGTVLLNGERYRKKTFKVGDVVSYRCKRGFKLSGPSFVTCSGIGKWKPWDKGTPVCSKRCRDPGTPKDGYLLKESFDVGEIVRFICNPGYTLKGSSQAVCRNNLEWSQPLPKCEASKCGKPDLPDNSHIYKGEKDSYTYGSRIILRCNRGYFLVGSTLMYCGAGGWKTPVNRQLRCLPKSCGSPNSISNGVIKGTLYTFGKSVTYECNTGYKLRGYGRRSCLATESWSGSPPMCEKVDCGDPDSIMNGKIEAYDTKYLDRASIRCDIGYTVKGSQSISCESNGKWSEIPECIGVTCDESYTSIEDGEAIGRHVDSVCYNSYNCKLTFTCNPGFELNTGRPKKIAVCQLDGTWSSLKPYCLRISCGRPLIPSYGSLKQGGYNFLYESVVEYECNSGYDMVGKSTRECLADGRWSANLPDCIANCGEPGFFDNGHVNGSSYKSGDRLTFSCKYGYELLGESSIICDQRTARWNPGIPNCRQRNYTSEVKIYYKAIVEICHIQYGWIDSMMTNIIETTRSISCGAPLKPLYGNLKPESNLYFLNSIIEFGCNDGYDLIGNSTRQCLHNKQWSGEAPYCQANCQDPGIPENGLREGNEFTGGKLVRFKCKDGYTLIGADKLTCEQSTGKWTRKRPKCEKKCDVELGMEDSRITDDQISMTNSVSPNTAKPRLNSVDRWCGRYISGEVAVRIKFKSAVKIVGVFFDRRSVYKANKGWFNYFDATRRSSVFVRSKSYDLERGIKYLELPQAIYTSYFEIVMGGKSGQAVCEKFEIYGCNATITCPIPDAPINGEVLGLLYKNGQKAVYSCSFGYKLKNNDMAQTCMANGSWTGSIPECIRDHQQIGCYRDIPRGATRSYPNFLGHPDKCVEWCRGQEYRYAELQYAAECRCSNALKDADAIPTSECNFPCSRDPTRKCGGPWIISAYKTGI